MMAWLSRTWSVVGDAVFPLTDVKVASVAAVISVLAITWPLRYQKSAALLDQAVRALERAYNALTVDGSQIAPVPADRLGWLTAARNIETYKALKKKIRVGLHRRILEDHEEDWRHRFYVALQGHQFHQPSYYQEVAAPREHRTSGVEPHSAVIVHAFATWPKRRRDTLEYADFDDIFGETDPRTANIGLRLYLNRPRSLARFRDLPSPYPTLTWWRRTLRFLGLRKRL